MKKIRADVAIITDGQKALKIGKTTVCVPATHWNGKGIKWFDDNQINTGVIPDPKNG